MEKIELLKIIEEVYSKDCRLDGVEWLDEDLANILLEKFEQELDKAREEGCADGLELEQLLNAEFFEEDYQNPKRLKELMKRYKLKTKE